MIRRFFSRDEVTSSAEHATPNLRPTPPMAKRLNRNALTVAAVVMGMTVLTAIVVASPSREARQQGSPSSTADEAPPVPPRPAFLDQPARSSVPAEVVTPDAPPAPRIMESSPSTPKSVPTPAIATNSHSYPDMYGGVAGQPALRDPSATNVAAPASQRERSYHAALASSLIVGAAESKDPSSSANQPPTLAVQEQQLLSLGDSVMRASMRPTGSDAAPNAATREANGGGASPSDLRSSFSSRATSAAAANVVAQLEPASTAFALRAGTVIPGFLITSVNSELPGEIVGQVSRNVYDSRTQRLLLIPKGSRLVGSYDNQVAAGQGRLLVAWTRLILPDGRSMRLPGLALADRQGNAGAKGDVDNHWRRVFGNALLLSAIGAGVQLSQPAQSSVLAPPSSGQVVAGAVGQELSNVALEVLRRGMDVPPTISISAGQPFNVLLSGDLLFNEAYTPHS